MTELKIYDDAKALAIAAAELFVERAVAAVSEHGRFAVALAGGSTPRALYEELAKPINSQRMDWAKVHLFWGDERSVPPDHPQSNFHMAQNALIRHVPLPPKNIHRIRAEKSPHEAARLYEQELRQFFPDAAGPRFDLVLLGMGDDGHTASLFPHSEALHEQERWVVANQVQELKTWRITLTPVAINSAAQVAFVVSGSGKKERLRSVLEGARQPEKLPAQLVHPDGGQLIWLVDADAAAQLSRRQNAF